MINNGALMNGLAFACRVVFKVVPVEGAQLINGAPQKLAQEMAAEALIALTLTSLRHESSGAASKSAWCWLQRRAHPQTRLGTH